jgi:hypothetical protein
MTGATQDAYEIERTCIRCARMQRRRKHKRSQRPRKGDDFATGLW